MGVAAYNRGSRVISRQAERDLYRAGLGPDPDRLPAKPTPRPSDWGAKALARAVELVRRQLRGAARMANAQGQAVDVAALLDYLPEYLQGQHGVSIDTARRAVAMVRAEQPRDNPQQPYYVYAILLDPLAAHRQRDVALVRAGARVYYVGQTAHTDKERLMDHLRGGRTSNTAVRDHAVRLVGHKGPYGSRDAAEDGERREARRLRGLGHVVISH